VSAVVQSIGARDNPLLVRLRRLARGGTAYRKQGQVWIEGEHLCSALRARGGVPAQAVIAESAWADPRLRELALGAARVARVSDALFATVSALESPASLGYAIELPAYAAIDATQPTVVLDRVQDAGNVGSILRSAAALGFGQVVAIEGTAGLWSPKVLRAGMGAHFGLRLIEGLQPGALDALDMPLLAASSHASQSLADVAPPYPCAWVFGHEGQGIDAVLAARCTKTLRIPQPGGEESLNVAAAAAICLYASRAGARA
jgi:RNA methyltransferase, TrmH family